MRATRKRGDNRNQVERRDNRFVPANYHICSSRARCEPRPDGASIWRRERSSRRSPFCSFFWGSINLTSLSGFLPARRSADRAKAKQMTDRWLHVALLTNPRRPHVIKSGRHLLLVAGCRSRPTRGSWPSCGRPLRGAKGEEAPKLLVKLLTLGCVCFSSRAGRASEISRISAQVSCCLAHAGELGRVDKSGPTGYKFQR